MLPGFYAPACAQRIPGSFFGRAVLSLESAQPVSLQGNVCYINVSVHVCVIHECVHAIHISM